MLADAREAGQDAVDAVLGLIPEVEHKLPPVYPRIDAASVLTISHHHTVVALRNAHTQILDLIRTHVAGREQAGVFFNTILPITWDPTCGLCFGFVNLIRQMLIVRRIGNCCRDFPRPHSVFWGGRWSLVIVDDDDSTPLPGKQKAPKKLLPVEEEATEVLIQRLKGEAKAVQYNLELAALVDYQNKSIPNLKGPPNTDDHSKYLSQIRDISWSYPAKGNLRTARQYFQELQACKNPETVEQGDAVLQDRGMLGIPQESSKSGPIKAWYVILVLPEY